MVLSSTSINIVLVTYKQNTETFGEEMNLNSIRKKNLSWRNLTVGLTRDTPVFPYNDFDMLSIEDNATTTNKPCERAHTFERQPSKGAF